MEANGSRPGWDGDSDDGTEGEVEGERTHVRGLVRPVQLGGLKCLCPFIYQGDEWTP